MENANFAKQINVTITDTPEVFSTKVKKEKYKTIGYSQTVIHFPFTYLAISIVLESRRI